MKPMIEKLVSVVVPCYNHANYVEAALQSVFEQTYPHLELIVLDDASKDESPAIIEEIFSRQEFRNRFEERLTFIRHSKNAGAHNTINEGLERASGAVLSILNSDDCYVPSRMECAIRALSSGPSQFWFSGVSCIDGASRDVSYATGNGQRLTRIQSSIDTFPSVSFAALLHNVAISTGNFVFTRGLLERVGFFRDYLCCHDYDFLMRSILLTEPIYAREPLYRYRLHGANSIWSLNAAGQREGVELMLDYYSAVHQQRCENPLAPTPKNWPGVFEAFCESHGHKELFRLAQGRLEDKSSESDRAFIQERESARRQRMQESKKVAPRKLEAVDESSVEGAGSAGPSRAALRAAIHERDSEIRQLSARVRSFEAQAEVKTRMLEEVERKSRELERALDGAKEQLASLKVRMSRAWGDNGPESAGMLRAVARTLAIQAANRKIRVVATKPSAAERPANLALLKNHPLFDGKYYTARNTDVDFSRVDPVAHYVDVGAFQGRDPHPLFDSSYYADCNPDVIAGGSNPLVHYIRFGVSDGRDPHPLFSTTYYLRQLKEPLPLGVTPLEHFWNEGARKGLSSHPLFSPIYYLERYPDVVADGANPLVHYVEHGAKEDRAPSLVCDGEWYGPWIEQVLESIEDSFFPLSKENWGHGKLMDTTITFSTPAESKRAPESSPPRTEAAPPKHPTT
jgi:glycosyltransferase involved in cell wall biosynthesis